MTKAKIVIVEDDPFYGEILRKYVSQIAENLIPQSDVSIIHLTSGEECMECLDPETNIFILDYDLTGGNDEHSLNGLDLLKEINTVCPAAYKIIVTSYSDFSTINSFTLEGADRYILKKRDTPMRIYTILKELIQERWLIKNT